MDVWMKGPFKIVKPFIEWHLRREIESKIFSPVREIAERISE